MKLFVVFGCLLLSAFSTAEETDPCAEANHNDNIVEQCIERMDERYTSAIDIKEHNKTCEVSHAFDDCIKEKGGFCDDQGKEGKIIDVVLDYACKNENDADVLWELIYKFENSTEEQEEAIKASLNTCIEESHTLLLDLSSLFSNINSDNDSFKNFMESIYVCTLASVAKGLDINLISLNKLVELVIRELGYEWNNVEVCQTKMTLANELCAAADKCHKNNDHNDDTTEKCLDGIDDFPLSHYKEEGQTCALKDKIHQCVETNGGFCENQSDLGPALMKVIDHACDHPEDAVTFWDAIDKVVNETETLRESLMENLELCINETSSHFMNHPGLTFVRSDQNEFEKYFQSLYVCVVASAADVLQLNYQSLGRLTNVFVDGVGLDASGVNFCDEHLTLPRILCAAS